MSDANALAVIQPPRTGLEQLADAFRGLQYASDSAATAILDYADVIPSGVNAYLCCIDEAGWVIVMAQSRGQAHIAYLDEISADSDAFTDPCSIRLLERNVEPDVHGHFSYLKTRGDELIMAGVIMPDWWPESGWDE